MKWPQNKICNHEDIARRALFTRRLARQAKQPRRGLRSPIFRFKSYMHKMRGSNIVYTSPGSWDLFWSCVGCFFGILILTGLDHLFFTGDQLLLLGSFGASSLIVFGSPHSPFAQPRSLIGGQVISAFVGVSMFLLFADFPMLAASLAVALAMLFMQLTGTMHPPGGATALIAVSGHPVVQKMGYFYTILPVASGFFILLLIAIFINNIPRDRQYPLRWF